MSNSAMAEGSALRRLPVYLLLDCSGSMIGEPIEAVNAGLGIIYRSLTQDPQAVETVEISVIRFADAAEQEPLTPLQHFVPPSLTAAGNTAMGAAIHVLVDSITNDVRPNTPVHKGDYSPMVFLLTDGLPTDDWRGEVAKLKSLKGNQKPLVVALGCGKDLVPDMLGLVADYVFLTRIVDPIQIKAFFRWISESIAVASHAFSSENADDLALPDLAVPGVVYYPGPYEEHARGAGPALPDFPTVDAEAKAEPLPPPPPQAPASQPAPAPSVPFPARAPSAPAPVRQTEQAFGQPGGYGAPVGGSSPSQEQATFTAYCPKEVAPREWRPLLVYISADTAVALAAVNADAAERLGARKDQFRPTTPSGPAQLRRAAQLTIVPRLPGFAFNPATLTVRWEEDVQRHEFRLSATSATPGQASNGAITILEGPFLRAEIPISVFVQQGQARLDTPEGFTSALARVYRRIFASYSRKDSAIVRLCEAAARAIGDRYLMDLNILRSGDRWDDRLLNAIAEADVFQLFWSETAAKSPNVEREWRYALQLAPARPNFIRPVYWTSKPYSIPAELSAFHFDHLDPAQVGLKPARFSLAALFGRA